MYPDLFKLETNRHEIAELSQYTTEVIRERNNSEIEERVVTLEIATVDAPFLENRTKTQFFTDFSTLLRLCTPSVALMAASAASFVIERIGPPDPWSDRVRSF